MVDSAFMVDVAPIVEYASSGGFSVMVDSVVKVEFASMLDCCVMVDPASMDYSASTVDSLWVIVWPWMTMSPWLLGLHG